MDKINEANKKVNKLNNKVKELNESFERIINFSNKLNEISIENERLFWTKLFNTAMSLIKKADYGSVYKYEEGNVVFLDAVGHDLKLLKQLDIDESVFQFSDRKNQVTIISEVINITKESTDKETYDKLALASKPIKDSITFDLYFKNDAIGGITLDIDGNSDVNFSNEDKKILNYLLNITEAFYRKDVEKRLKEHQAYFQQLFDESTEAIALLDNKSNIIKVNKSFEEIFGYKAAEIKGENIDELITPAEKLEEGLEYTEKNIAGQEVKLETVRKTKEGNRIYVSLHSFPINLEKGQIGIYAIYNDITERKETEQKLKRQKAYFQQLFDESTEAIALLNNNNEIIKINNSFKNLFGYSIEEARGKDIDNLIVPEDRREEGVNYTDKVLNNKDVETESVRQTKEGKKINVSIHAFPISLEEGQIGLYAIYNDITQRKKEEEEIKYLSFHDQMTGLYNRRFFESEMQRLDNSRLLPISIIMSDIDGLKNVNDKLGHSSGDEYIKIVAEEIQKAVRSEDILARVGGDEFAILLPKTSEKEVKKIEQRIQSNVDKLNSKYKYPVGISTGYGVKKDAETNLEDIFKKADYYMYKMKNRC